MSPFRKFLIQYSQYFGANAISILLGLITFPILTRILTKEQYGVLGLVNTTIMIAFIFSKAGLSDGIIRLYPQYDHSEEHRAVFASTVIFRGVLISLLVVILYLLMVQPISNLLKVEKEYVVCFIIMAGSLFIRPLNLIVFNLMRVNQKALQLSIIETAAKIIGIVLSLLFLLSIIGKFHGYFLGVVLADFILFMALLYWFFVCYKVSLRSISRDLTKKLITFGAPLLFMELSYSLLSYADRYIISAYYGADMLGLYSVGYNMAMYIGNIITFPLSYAIIPMFVRIYEKDGRGKTEEFLQKSLNYLLISMIPVCFGYYLISRDLLITLASQKYAGAALFSPLIVVATLLLGLNNVFNAGLYLHKKTATIFGIMVSAVIINVAVNMLTVPKYGVMGAAYTMLLSTLIANVLTVGLSYKYISIKVNMKTIIYYLVVSSVMLLISGQIEMAESWLNLILKCLSGMLIVTIGVLWREKEILLRLRSVFSR